MAKEKKLKLVRAPQYEKILERNGMTMADATILGFRFKTKAEADAFHYALMSAKAEYIMYDGASERVKILAAAECPIRTIAESLGGEYYKPTVLNDYE